jgi:uncharacterized protein YdeI (YjbR/CyaY-like superfamily)
MIKTTTAYHKLNKELKSKIETKKLEEVWNSLTDIQRNEWVCFTSNAKKEETNSKRLERAVEDLLNGKKTPCCWPGCPHRRQSAAKWFK